MALDPNIQDDAPLPEGEVLAVPAEPISAPAEVRSMGQPGSMVRKIAPYTAQLNTPVAAPAAAPYTQILAQQPAVAAPTGTGAENTDAYAGTVLGIMDSNKTNKPVFQAVADATQSVSQDLDAQRKIYYSMLKEVDDVGKAQLWNWSGLGEDGRVELARAAKSIVDWKKAAGSSFAGFESAFTPILAQNIATIVTQEGAVAQELAFTQYGEATAAKRWGDTWSWDTIKDFAITAVAPSTTTAMAQWFDKFPSNLVGDIVAITKDTGSRIATGSYKNKGFDTYMKVLGGYWQQDVATRAYLYTEIEKHIDMVSGGNKFTYMAMISPFLYKDEFGSLQLDYAADTAGIVGFILSRPSKMLASARRIMNSRKTASILLKSGNKEKAGELIADALKENDLARVKKGTGGMTKEDVAVSAHPIDLGVQFPGQIQGAAADAANKIANDILEAQRTVDAALAEAYDAASTIKRDYFDTTAKEAKQKKVLGELNDTSGVASAHILESDETGFTIGIVKDSNVSLNMSRDELEIAKRGVEQQLKDTTVEKLSIAEERHAYKEAGYPDEFINSVFAERETTIATETSKLQKTLDDLNTRWAAYDKQVGVPDTKIETDELGNVTVRSANGETVAEESNGYIVSKRSDTAESAKGGGEGTARARALVEYAASRGLKYGSDVSVSPEMQGVYRRLEQLGYKVTKNPSEVNPTTGNLISKDPRVPVFEVGPRDAQVIRSSDGGEYVVQRYHYSYNEMGEFDTAERIGAAEAFLKSPVNTVERLGAQVSDATLVGMQEAGIVSKLRKVLQEVRSKAGPFGNRRVDKILLEGDEMGKVYSIRELLDGVQTSHGLVKLKSSDEIALYYASRRMADHLHELKNAERLKDLKFNNYKELTTDLKYDNGDQIKLFSKESDIHRAVPSDVRRVFDFKTNSVVNVTDIAGLEERLAKTERVLRLRTGQRFGDEIIEYAIVDPAKLRTPSGRVLRYVEGYIPRFREGINYIVKQKVDRMVNGVKTEQEQVVRFFSTKSDAEKFIAGSPDRATLRWDVDKKLSHDYEGLLNDKEFESLNFGGTFDGERTDRSILFGLDGAAAERRSAVASLDSYINHVANRFSTFDLKNSLVGKFQNTYGKYLTNPSDWRSPIHPHHMNDLSLRSTIEAERTFIGDMMRMPDRFNKYMTDRIRSFSEWVDGTDIVGSKTLSRATMSLATKDPIGVMKTAAYHQYLGFWNVGSLITQMYGTSIAMTAYPLKAMKLLPQSMAVRAAIAARFSPEVLERIAMSAGLPGKWLKNVITEMNKTHLLESLFTTGDYNHAIKGAGIMSQRMTSIMEKGQVFTKEGESWTRVYGYLLARDNFMKGKPVGYVLKDKEIAQVVNDSLRYTLNLNHAARAQWQKGVLGATTQFWQITAKFGENLLANTKIPFTNKELLKGSSQWTGAEKAKILLGHIALFGAAGMPFFDSILNSANQMYSDSKNSQAGTEGVQYNIFDFTGMPQSQIDRAISGGANDVLAFMLTGADLDVSRRASIPYSVQDMVELYNTGDKSLIAALGGASIPALNRFIEAMAGLNEDTHALEHLRVLMGANDMASGVSVPKLNNETKWRVLRDFAGIVSSTRNFDRAAWWNDLNYVANSKGQNLLGGLITDQEQDALIVAEALGIHSKKVRQSYLVDKENKAQEAQVAPRIKAAVGYIMKYIPADGQADTDGRVEEFKYAINAACIGMSEEYQIKIRQGIFKELVNKDKPIVAGWISKYYANYGKYTATSANTFSNLALSDLPQPAGAK